MALAGFPVQNFAAHLRSLNSPAGVTNRQAMAIPRQKFTFLIELHFSYPALLQEHAQTNVFGEITNGRLYGQLKSISYPKPRFEIETLRSYNRYRKIYKKLTYEPATIVWTDDSTSMVQSLIKEYIAFYHETGGIGTNDISFDDQQISNEVGLVGANVRNGMNLRPSLGLKMRPQYLRHFFESITIYDLGTEPNAINLHTFHTPVIINFDHDDLDWYSSDMINSRWSFEYENYSFSTGQQNDQFSAIFDQILGGNAKSPIDLSTIPLRDRL